MLRTAMTVLLVESAERDAVEIAKAITAAAPFWRVDRAKTLAAALEAIDRERPDMVVADLRLADADGLEVIERLVAAGEAPMPMVVLTRHDDDEEGLEAIQHGAQDYLMKEGLDGAQLIRSLRYAVERTRVRSQLSSSEARYAALIDALAEGVVVQDGEGRLIEANPAASAILGIPLDAILTAPPSFPMWNAVTANGAPVDEHMTPGRTALRTGEVQRDVVLGCLRPDGGTTWIEANAAPVLCAPGRPDVVIVSFRDITDRRAAEEEIRFKTRMLEVAGQAIVAADPRGGIVYWNPAAEQLYGWRADEVMGQSLSGVILLEEMADQTEELLVRMIAGESWTGEFPVRHRGGRAIPVLVCTTPMFDDNGHLVATIGLASDLSERKAAEEARAHLSALIEGSDDAILGIDLDGVVESWNPGATALFGFEPEETIGQHITLIAGEDRAPEVEVSLASVRRDEAVAKTVRQRHKDGSLVDVSITISPVRDQAGRVVGSSVIARDIRRLLSLERAAEEQRRQLAEADRLAEISALEHEAAERASCAKNEFLSRMSHELRTPLNTVIGFSQLLQRQPLTPEDRDAVALINAAGHHLLDLINEVLDISCIEAGGLHLSIQTVSLADVVRVATEFVEPDRRANDVTIVGSQVDPSLMVRADRQRLLQILLNLLSNAVKYNLRGGKVDLSVAPVGEDRLRLAVSNTGAVIAAADLDKLFVPFERLGAERSTVEGAGIGLALSLALAQAMEGTIGVESTRARGTTFWCDLPVAQPEPPNAPPEAGPAPDGARHEPIGVLYIEDNLPSRRLVKQTLEEDGMARVTSTTQGLVGIALAKQLLPDVILLDLHLPDLHGAEVLSRLRADRTTTGIPVVVVTADATDAQRERLLEIGADDYLTKPVDLVALTHVVLDLAQRQGTIAPH